ncbi:MAG: ABC transporter ATP-binding protein [Candidatus Nezhaarchaeales archaeon]
MTILEVKDLKLYYRTLRGPLKAVDKISFRLEKGETLAIVGESGCGKSSTAIAIMRLLPPNTHTYEGSVKFEGQELMSLKDEEFRKMIMWKKMSMVFQGAMNSLNPVVKVGEQLAEPLMVHGGMDRKEALERAREMLKLVNLPEYILNRYPHELSGGMKQRIIIAMALIMTPPIVILDEPTSALDVITQANIMNLLKNLKWKLKLSYIFITHDLPLASELADKVAVMYAGKIVELGKAEQIFNSPLHPYTQRLISSVPTLRTEKLLNYIPGSPPDLVQPPTGCRFYPRCDLKEKCLTGSCSEVELKDVGEEHYVACSMY